MGTRERRERSDRFDRELATLFRDALDSLAIDSDAIALAAVGGYGRGELSPGSDLDILILHSGIQQDSLKELVNKVLFPLWGEKLKIDYAIRTTNETLEAVSEDIKVALGLLDLRPITGNIGVVEDLKSKALDLWRRDYKRNIPKLRASLDERHERFGELAYLLEPDLKEARGGLRDISVLRALAKIEIVEISLARIAAAESVLMSVRDALHKSSGRDRDQLLFTEQDKVANLLEYIDADALMAEVAKSARAIDYVSARAWDGIERSLRKNFFKRSRPVAVAKGLVEYESEVAIDENFSISEDPTLGLRAAAVSAQRGLHLTIDACMAMATELKDLPTPWPRQSREDLVTLIGAGEHMVEVFEALDQEGLISRWIPEWEHVRFLPQRNVLHRHTVDRHMIETALKAATLTRRVHRPGGPGRSGASGRAGRRRPAG